MYKEIVGHTAIRKSSKLEEIIKEVDKRLMDIQDPVDYINVFYFLNRLNDFDLLHRIDRRKYFEFKNRAIESAV